jgi:tRNA-splicing ligase RtcB (3'-phosphate/5'-hydroxy nucleic acid ligase)
MARLERLDDTRWRIPRTGGMRVDGIVYASEEMIGDIRDDASLEQVANVAHLPGILDASIAMPDIHWGYGFPIGGVAAMDADEGVVSPGGVGYDINCGVRLLTSRLEAADVEPLLPRLADRLFARVPTGVGATRSDLSLGRQELAGVLARGAAWAVERGFGERRDLETIEEGGALPGADPDAVSERAYARGRDQLGTLGSGNHFAEVQRVAEVYDEAAARAFGLAPGRVTVMIHSGSRGLGHQVATEHIQVMLRAVERYSIALPDRQLCCAPLASPEGRRYLAAMAAAANFAFANRQVMTHWARESFAAVLERPAAELGMDVVYDVCHNIAKIETFAAPGGGTRRACVHRKGATRAYPPGHPEVPARYREVGQPVLIPGDMGRYSFVLAGADRAYEQTFGSACHGAGRRLSRKAAKKAAKGRKLVAEMERRGVHVRAAGMATIAEEMPEAYKDVADVVEVVDRAGIARRVARLEPLAVIKG